MKRFILAMVLTAASAAALSADPSGGSFPRGPGGPPIERLAKDLGLTDDQKAQVEQILEAEHVKMEAARKQADAEILEELQSVLTPEQLTKFKQLQAERQQRMHDGPPPAAN